ncbi:MAG: molybdate transport system substrate-binding protein [Thermoleophilaceae bacterium]|jgi:molybdate transport system substrate-binding protein|nr:molybdate transport system substrate-binding protein [Thermoleophilaceae bacterium]
MRRLALLAILAVLAGCGGSSNSNEPPRLVVTAASSLRNAFADYGNQFHAAKVRLSFGGSDELAAQIRAGAPVDVFAAANTELPDQLFAEGEVEQPVIFTANELVLAVPKGENRVKQLDDLMKSGVKLGIGAKDVPVGTYTRKVLDGLPELDRNRILANVKTEEPDVAGIVGKLTQGAVNAGFIYVTDVKAASRSLHAIRLPSNLQPTAVYEAAIVKGTKHRGEAQQFLDGLVSGQGQDALRRAGFLPLPK